MYIHACVIVTTDKLTDNSKNLFSFKSDLHDK